MSETKTLITAKWLAPISSLPLSDGGIVIDRDRIAAVGGIGELRQIHPDAVVQNAGEVVLLPGLVNAHTHLEYSGCVAGESPPSFTDWILSLAGRIGPARDFAGAAMKGAQQSVHFGVTSAGDISQNSHLTRPVLRSGPLRVVSYGEVLGIGGNRGKVGDLLARATDTSSASPFLTIGVSPHAPYSLDEFNYRAIVETARKTGLPLATHVSELSYEQAFLRHHAGPFRELLERIGIWRDDIETFPGGPIAFAASTGLLELPNALLAHVNYCDDEELELLSAGRASIVYCPRTHEYFGHPPHRWREMLARDINVAVGTDSCASSPDLNLVDDLRLLHRVAPEIPPQTLWEMATIRGARAIGTDTQVGSLKPGKFADMVAFQVDGDEPLREVLESGSIPNQVWIAGQQRLQT